MAVLIGRISYHAIARVFKWLTLVLFAYVIAAFFAHPDWGAVAHATFVPRLEWSHPFLSTFVALLGTTISPYLFFWQAIQEVEEERDQGKVTVAQRRGATAEEKRNSRIDVITGMLLSTVIMYSVILTTGATLHVHGQTHITTTEQAAAALRPLAGVATYFLFTLGIIGTGMLSVPVLASSTAFAVAEGAKWRNSLACPPRAAPRFYAVLIATLLVGLGLNYLGFDVVAMLFWSAVINGVLAPPLIIMVVLLSTSRNVMGYHVSGPVLRLLGWLTAAVMTFAAVAMFIA
jgi:Mn2+/Fe2+ NRAMP family transporter